MHFDAKHLIPKWPKPANVHAYSTLRPNGHSQNVYSSFNLGDHVGDDPKHVAANRKHLSRELNLLKEPFWLEQVHGCEAVVIDNLSDQSCHRADASIASTPNNVCVIMTADCLPILFTNRQGTEVAAIHAGWRGLVGGVIEETLKKMRSDPQDILAWLGPAIGPESFEVGDEVYQQFITKQSFFSSGFKSHQPGKWLANLYTLASSELYRLGIKEIYSDLLCTYSDPTRFFSYRRDGQTGRMATLIWIEE